MDHSTNVGGPSSGIRIPAERARVLLEINNAIVSRLDLTQVLQCISDCLRREIKHDFAALALYDAERHELRLHALDFAENKGFLQKGQLIPLVGTPASLAFATRKPVLRHRPDFEEFPAPIMKEAYAKGLKSGCAVPLLCHEKIVGSMMLASLRESAFTEDDADLLAQIGAQVAIAVDNVPSTSRAPGAPNRVAAAPYGVVGAVAALWIMGTPFGFMAFLGVASLIGVIVSHVIVLFDFIEEKHEEGEPFEEALIDSGIIRCDR